MKAPLFLSCLLLSITTNAQITDSISISGVESEKNSVLETDMLDSGSSRYRISKVQFTTSDTLSTPNPSTEAVALHRYLKDMFGKKILSGQMWTPWGIHEIDYVSAKTGKKPAIAGFDYINESQNAGENQKAIDYSQNGGITTMMWHWGAPGVGEGYENSKATIDIDQCFIKNTPEYEDFRADLERIGNWLQKLEDGNVPVLWRPFHELDGHWFWWSKEGPEKFKKLWITMYDYLVHERELSNLIWVLCYTGNPSGEWFPGKEYVDIVGADTYDNTKDSHIGMYHAVLNASDDNVYPIAFHETGTPPNAEECIVDGAMWSWWMVWHTDWLEDIEDDYLNEQYNSHLVITHDELPDIPGVYGWEDDCEPTNISASVKIDDGEWLETNKIGIGTGESAILKVTSEGDGIWTWSGSGEMSREHSVSEKTITINELATITASILNTCGATSTQTFHVINHEQPAPLSVKEPSNTLNIYPSPTQDFLNISFNPPQTQEPIQVEIIDLNGRSFISTTITENTFRLDISGLNAGVYQISLQSGSYFTAEKFIKN